MGYYIQSNNSALYLPRGKYDLKKMLNKVNQSNCWLNKAHYSVIPCNLKQAIPSSHNIKILKMFCFDSVSCCICCSHLHWFPALLSCPGNSPLLDKSLYYWQHQERPPVWTTFNYTNDCEFFSSPFSFAFFILNLKRKWSSPDLTWCIQDMILLEIYLQLSLK